MTVIERIVFIHLDGQVDPVPAGRLEMTEEGRDVVASRFAYGLRYIERRDPRALPVDPVSLPLDDNVPGLARLPANRLTLFGAIRDATPDMWGRRVIENKLQAGPNTLPESKYLECAGSNRFGALDIRSQVDSPAHNGQLPGIVDLGYLLEATERVELGQRVPANLAPYLEGAPSMGGARPKAVVRQDDIEWIAKFPARDDRFNVPVIEQATLELARAAGMTVPRTFIETLADGRQVMLIERFDRQLTPNGLTRRHVVSALTMLGLHESESPDASYGDLSEVMGFHGATRTVGRDREELFARMVFNILVTNDDDHLRNHAFMHDRDGWTLTPLYDVVPKPQVGHERRLHLSVGPRGRLATLDNAFDGAGAFGLMPGAALEIIERIVGVVRQWREHFEMLGVNAQECDLVASAFRRAGDIGMREVLSRRRS